MTEAALKFSLPALRSSCVSAHFHLPVPGQPLETMLVSRWQTGVMFPRVSRDTNELVCPTRIAVSLKRIAVFLVQSPVSRLV
jgi:hypothetical protein